MTTRREIAANAGRLLAANTLGSITATFVIPFFVVPAVGSPTAVALLALVNVAMAVALVMSRSSGISRRSVAGDRNGSPRAVVVAIAIIGGLDHARSRSSTRASRGSSDSSATLFASKEDEIASVQAGATVTAQLWVTGTAMTLLTVDAKLMPILPLMVRPRLESAADRRVRDGLGVPRRRDRRA